MPVKPKQTRSQKIEELTQLYVTYVRSETWTDKQQARLTQLEKQVGKKGTDEAFELAIEHLYVDLRKAGL